MVIAGRLIELRGGHRLLHVVPRLNLEDVQRAVGAERDLARCQLGSGRNIDLAGGAVLVAEGHQPPGFAGRLQADPKQLEELHPVAVGNLVGAIDHAFAQMSE